MNVHGRKFLITGGAGFIGSNLVEYLINNGAATVRVLDNFSTGSIGNVKPFLHHPAFELIEGDIRDIDTCKKAVKDIQYVTHQAALGSVPRSIQDAVTTNSVNISGFLNMLEAAKQERVTRFIYAASSSTYGDHPDLPKVEDKIGNPLSPYAVTKYVNELYAAVYSRVYSFHTIGLRYFNVFGPKQDPNGPYAAVIPLFIKAALNNERPIIFGDGATSRDFTYVENAVQANIKALLHEPLSVSKVINIAVGESTSLNELWRILSAYADVNLEPIYKQERKGDVRFSLADISKATNELGYQPDIKVLEGLRLTLNWYAQNKTFQKQTPVRHEKVIVE